MHVVRTASREAPPGLHALLVYLRPAPRAKLLAAFAELGIFVSEQQGAKVPHSAPPHDMTVIVAADSEVPGDTLDTVLDGGRGALVVCLPPGADRAPLVQRGVEVITDDELAIPVRLAAIAQHAREARALRPPTPASVMLGDVELRWAPPSLHLGRLSVPLSRSEREVLVCLAASPGRPVSQQELERCAGGEGDVHPGFLKAVVMRIRRKLEELGGDPMILRTVRGFGYILLSGPR